MNLERMLSQINTALTNRSSPIAPKHFFPRYGVVCDKNDYTILRPSPFGKRIVAAWNNVVCATSHLHKNVIYLYPNYKNVHRYYRIPLNAKKFPELLPDSSICCCLIIPYIRQVSPSKMENAWRLVVITDKCQVYHNFPSRLEDYEGHSQRKDICSFVESAVWDLPGNKYPSKDPNCDLTEYYNPFLPESSYEYHPSCKEGLNQYGGKNFGKSVSAVINDREVNLSRFYFPFRNMGSNPFSYLGGYEPDYKMTLLGTYNSNSTAGTRTIIFATTDGGRNFFAKYEFADDGETKGNLGNALDGSVLSAACLGEMYVQKRTLNPDKDSSCSFLFGERIRIKEIVNSKPVLLKTECECDIDTGNIVLLSGIPDNGEWECLLRGGNNKSGNSDGNLFYKVKKIGDREFELFELTSKSQTSLPCKHIHGINRVKDGWLICTGETYPYGWMLYAQSKAADTWTHIDAKEPLQFFLLNRAENSVQRAIGSVLLDDIDHTLIVGSDSAVLHRNPFLNELSHGSTGIFKGKLSEIDDFATFQCICELNEPCYFMKEINGVYLTFCQRGEMAISFDKGNSWHKNRIDRPLKYYYGCTPEFVVIDGWLIVLKS